MPSLSDGSTEAYTRLFSKPGLLCWRRYHTALLAWVENIEFNEKRVVEMQGTS